MFWKGSAMGERCTWCDLIESGQRAVYEEPALVMFDTSTQPTSSRLTLVPRAHVSVVTELPVPAMAAVLAGLARATGPDSGRAVQVSPKPDELCLDHAHLHFDLVLEEPAGESQPA